MGYGDLHLDGLCIFLLSIVNFCGVYMFMVEIFLGIKLSICSNY